MKRLVQLVVCLVLISTAAFAGKGGFGERLFFQVGGTIGADGLTFNDKAELVVISKKLILPAKITVA